MMWKIRNWFNADCSFSPFLVFLRCHLFLVLRSNHTPAWVTMGIIDQDCSVIQLKVKISDYTSNRTILSLNTATKFRISLNRRYPYSHGWTGTNMQ